MHALRRRFPALDIPALPLTALPTPVDVVTLEGRRFFVKRDDLTSALYGGNKVRKLAFLLARAREKRHKRVATVGAIGSNHCLATAIHGAASGFEVEVRHLPQPVTPHVRANLRSLAATGARLQLSGGPVPLGVGVAVDRSVKTGWSWIPPGGSNALGALGFVDAALELADQIEAGVLPKPARIYVALGSGGTHAGLAAGFALAGLEIPVCGVQVVPGPWIGPKTVARIGSGALRLLRPHIQASRLRSATIEVDGSELGPGYGHETPSSRAAGEVMTSLGIATEGTYTAKAFAAMVRDLRADVPGPLLFWQTLSAVQPEPGDVGKLPLGYRRFFEDG